MKVVIIRPRCATCHKELKHLDIGIAGRTYDVFCSEDCFNKLNYGLNGWGFKNILIPDGQYILSEARKIKRQP